MARTEAIILGSVPGPRFIVASCTRVPRLRLEHGSSYTHTWLRKHGDWSLTHAPALRGRAIGLSQGAFLHRFNRCGACWVDIYAFAGSLNLILLLRLFLL